jgi:transposase
MSKSQAARTFDVSLSSVKRYVDKAHRGESLAAKKSPGSAPELDQKATKLLEEDLKERPYATLQERRDYTEAVRGISVSRSTLCRALAPIGSTRKKGASRHRACGAHESSLASAGG